jgi:hypothetical protein
MSIKVTNEWLAWIKKITEKATPGPWTNRFRGRYHKRSGTINSIAHESNINVCHIDWMNDSEHFANSDFIAASREAIPALITEIERLKKIIET